MSIKEHRYEVEAHATEDWTLVVVATTAAEAREKARRGEYEDSFSTGRRERVIIDAVRLM